MIFVPGSEKANRPKCIYLHLFVLFTHRKIRPSILGSEANQFALAFSIHLNIYEYEFSQNTRLLAVMHFDELLGNDNSSIDRNKKKRTKSQKKETKKPKKHEES